MSLVNLPLTYQPYTGTTEPSLGAYRDGQTLACVFVQSFTRYHWNSYEVPLRVVAAGNRTVNKTASLLPWNKEPDEEDSQVKTHLP